MKRLLYFASIVFAALVFGIGSAWWAIERSKFSAVQYGSWYHNPLVGSIAAGDYLRAQIARIGLLALNRSEAIYFLATWDDEGNKLRCDCTYRIEGRDIESRWWSITAYGDDLFLMPNEQNRYSYNMTNLARKADSSFTIYLSRSPKNGNWIPTGSGETFDLILRLYNPAPKVINNLSKIELPRIFKEDCP